MRASRLLSSRSTRHYVTPSHCGACPSPRWQGKRQCRCCSTLRSTTMTSANGVAMSRASTRCVHKTRSLASATRTSLAASVRPCCRRRSASRLLATFHAAEHLSSPETGHARCCRGPRSVDRVPGGVRGDGQKHAAVGGDQVQGGDSLHLDLPVRCRCLDGSTCALMDSTTRRWCRRCS